MRVASADPTAMPVSHVERCMGTVFSFRVPSPGVGRHALDDAVTWLHAMDAVFSTYRPDSEISRLDAGTLRLADASPVVREVLTACEGFRIDTDGFFDARADGRTLDPSGYVKGWAIARVADLLAAAGSVNHCVNGGGDVACAGRPAPGRGWRIGGSDPFHRGRLLDVVEGTGPVAIATSGLAERGAHIVDPHTRRRVTGLASVTVVAADLCTADVYATAATAMGEERAVDWLGARPSVRALVVAADGRRIRTGRWPAPVAEPLRSL